MVDSTHSPKGPSPKPAPSKPPFRRHPSRFVADADAAAGAIIAHLDSTAGHFDLISRSSDPARITADDIVAVSMLGVPIPPEASAWILSAEGQWLTTEILADVPHDDRLWDCDARSILRAADLFRLLRATTSQIPPSEETPALGQASATRLLAAKRPMLVPVDDREIRDCLRYSKDSLWFRRWKATLDEDLLTAARTARERAADERPVAAGLSELRVIDIVVRRRAKRRRRP